MSVYPTSDPAYPPMAPPPMAPPPNPYGANAEQFMAQSYAGGVGGAGNKPQGLDVLDDREMVRIEKLYDDNEEITGISQARKFKVLNDGSRQLFSMTEVPNRMSSHQHYRAFEVKCKDNEGRTVFKILRDCEKSCSYCFFCCACCDCCRTDAKVKVGTKVIGNIAQNCSMKSPSFTVYRGEQTDVKLLQIDGLNKCMEMCSHYELRYPGESRVSGSLRKKGTGYGGHENSYYVYFPDSADQNLKIMCIASMILFDYRFHNIYPGQHPE